MSNCLLPCSVWIYNMVDMAVFIAIFAMHQKSGIDFYNARKFEKKFRNWAIHASGNHNDEIAQTS